MMHILKRYIHSLQLKDSQGDVILNDSVDYQKFLHFLDVFCAAKNKTVLYRGTNRLSVYNVEVFNTKEFSRKMFMVGCKGHYYEPHKTALFCIDDCSEDLFGFIFDKINEIIHSLHSQREEIKYFFERNDNINDYFSNNSNRLHFISSIKVLGNNLQHEMKDYYLSLMHVMGKKVSPNSYMISTSKQLHTAQCFQNGGVVIVTWIHSSRRKDTIIKFVDVNRTEEHVRELGLPFYKKSPYYGQQEICIKGGIVPHFIIGYAYKHSFIVNPYLLSQISDEYNVDEIIKNGIDIDQKDFNIVLDDTQYKGGFITIDGFYFDF